MALEELEQKLAKDAADVRVVVTLGEALESRAVVLDRRRALRDLCAEYVEAFDRTSADTCRNLEPVAGEYPGHQFSK